MDHNLHETLNLIQDMNSNPEVESNQGVDLNQEMTLNQIMSKNVVSVNPQQSVSEAAQKMSQHNVGSLPVVQNGEVIGILTDRDISLRATSKGLDPNTTNVDAIMSTNLVTGSPQMDIQEASRLMQEKQIRRLPVIENNQLSGIVALGDFATQDNFQDEAEETLSSISEPSNPQM